MVLLGTLSLSLPAWASLDADQSSVTRDRAVLKAGKVERVSVGTFSVHRYTLQGGTEVREYVAASGKVFAVTWHGPHIPNLQQLLGVHHSTFLNASSRQRGGVNNLVVRDDAANPNLIVESHGHQRAFHGRAYLLHALPAGVSPADIS
jgi:hypothetical protein